MPKVYIIVLNWNGWRDTIECLESVLRLDYDHFRVMVCDNASEDDSLDRIADWAGGSLAAGCSNPALQRLTFPPYPKPISFLRIGQGDRVSLESRSEMLFLVQTGANLGFAGGNNVGLRLALGGGDLDYAWLLNNDTVVEPGALSSLVAAMQMRPDVGLCGSTLLYYHSPRTVQALGGSIYNRWTARVGHIGLGLDIDDAPPHHVVECRMKYVVGASMFVRNSFLEQIGLLDERYFLYFEEIDWAKRAKGLFGLAYCPGSIVYHKEGASIGTSDLKGKQRSELSERFASRNRVLFTRIHYPAALATVIFAMLLSALHRLLTGQIRSFAMLVEGISSGLYVRKNTATHSTASKGGAVLVR
ncbi:MAG: glycosyltransferase family 2 protein [Terracidiphilus sp.]|jgi:GT2 family glycosyltransferase